MGYAIITVINWKLLDSSCFINKWTLIVEKRTTPCRTYAFDVPIRRLHLTEIELKLCHRHLLIFAPKIQVNEIKYKCECVCVCVVGWRHTYQGHISTCGGIYVAMAIWQAAMIERHVCRNFQLILNWLWPPRICFAFEFSIWTLQSARQTHSHIIIIPSSHRNTIK